MNDFAKLIHEGNASRGFWENPMSVKKCAALALGELYEAIEAHRKGRFITSKIYKDFELEIKDSVQDELADAVIRLLDYSAYYKIDVSKALQSDDISELSTDFVEAIFDITTLFSRYYKTNTAKLINLIYGLSKHENIDLMWHVQEKLKYNATRPYKHGKKY